MESPPCQSSAGARRADSIVGCVLFAKLPRRPNARLQRQPDGRETDRRLSDGRLVQLYPRTARESWLAVELVGDGEDQLVTRSRPRPGLRRAWSFLGRILKIPRARICGPLVGSLRTRAAFGSRCLTAALREGAPRHRCLPGQPSDCRAPSPEHSAATGLASQQQCYSIMESRAVEAPAAAVPDDRCRPPPQTSGALLDEEFAAAAPYPCSSCAAFHGCLLYTSPSPRD